MEDKRKKFIDVAYLLINSEISALTQDEIATMLYALLVELLPKEVRLNDFEALMDNLNCMAMSDFKKLSKEINDYFHCTGNYAPDEEEDDNENDADYNLDY